MTNEQINDYYDSHPNLTVAQLSRMTGKTVEQLKLILMPDYYQYWDDIKMTKQSN